MDKYYTIVTTGRGAKYCVCLYVGLAARISQKIPRSNFTKDSVHVTCGRGSVLLRRKCNMLYTSGLVDDVMLSHHGTNDQNQRRRVCFVEFARWRHVGIFSFCSASRQSCIYQPGRVFNTRCPTAKNYSIMQFRH